MYHKIPAGKRSTHKLPKWASLRPESRLEKFHELLAHMANSGMNAGLSDALTLGGTSEHNIKCRWKHFVNLERLADKEIKIPVHFIDEPQFWDHSLLGYLNQQAQSLRLSVPFQNVTPIRANNGEVFLSKYFKEQQQRNRKNIGFLDSMCLCDTCISYKPMTTLDPPSAAPDNNTDGRRESVELARRPSNTRTPVYSPPMLDPAPVPVRPLPVVNDLPMYNGCVPQPVGCCFPTAPFYCHPKGVYHWKKMCGERVLGRPPACDLMCPMRMCFRPT